MMSDPDSGAERAGESIPTCRFLPECTQLLIPGGCDTCDFTNPDLPRDEDGDPIRSAGYPAG